MFLNSRSVWVSRSIELSPPGKKNKKWRCARFGRMTWKTHNFENNIKIKYVKKLPWRLSSYNFHTLGLKHSDSIPNNFYSHFEDLGDIFALMSILVNPETNEYWNQQLFLQKCNNMITKVFNVKFFICEKYSEGPTTISFLRVGLTK